MADDAKPKGHARANSVAEAGDYQVTLRFVLRGSQSTTRLSADALCWPFANETHVRSTSCGSKKHNLVSL